VGLRSLRIGWLRDESGWRRSAGATDVRTRSPTDLLRTGELLTDEDVQAVKTFDARKRRRTGMVVRSVAALGEEVHGADGIEDRRSREPVELCERSELLTRTVGHGGYKRVALTRALLGTGLR
jgi:hypothetical protein